MNLQVLEFYEVGKILVFNVSQDLREDQSALAANNWVLSFGVLNIIHNN